MRQASWVAEEPAPEDRGIEPTSESLTLHIDHDAKKGNDSSAKSTTPEIQE
jgi:hypothetical protein